MESKSREKLSRSVTLTLQSLADTGALTWMLQSWPMLAISWPPPVIRALGPHDTSAVWVEFAGTVAAATTVLTAMLMMGVAFFFARHTA
jgi:hypothetical protein